MQPILNRMGTVYPEIKRQETTDTPVPASDTPIPQAEKAQTELLPGEIYSLMNLQSQDARFQLLSQPRTDSTTTSATDNGNTTEDLALFSADQDTNAPDAPLTNLADALATTPLPTVTYPISKSDIEAVFAQLAKSKGNVLKRDLITLANDTNASAGLKNAAAAMARFYSRFAIATNDEGLTRNDMQAVLALDGDGNSLTKTAVAKSLEKVVNQKADVIRDFLNTNNASNNNRVKFREWAKELGPVMLNKAIASLSTTDKDRLLDMVVKINVSSDAPADMINNLIGRIKSGLKTILRNPDLGFYAEILSYTPISLNDYASYASYDPNMGKFGAVQINPRNFGNGGTRDVLIHELFHSYNFNNEGPPPINAMDEGVASFMFRAAFSDGSISPEESWAEAVFGTKLFYRDYLNMPNVPITSPANIDNPKLRPIYNMLQRKDPTHLPWNDTEKLNQIYNKYWAGLRRNVSDQEWAAQVREAVARMKRDGVI